MRHFGLSFYYEHHSSRREKKKECPSHKHGMFDFSRAHVSVSINFHFLRRQRGRMLPASRPHFELTGRGIHLLLLRLDSKAVVSFAHLLGAIGSSQGSE